MSDGLDFYGKIHSLLILADTGQYLTDIGQDHQLSIQASHTIGNMQRLWILPASSQRPGYFSQTLI